MMTFDLQIIRAALKQGGASVPLARKSMAVVKEMKNEDPGGALQSRETRPLQ